MKKLLLILIILNISSSGITEDTASVSKVEELLEVMDSESMTKQMYSQMSVVLQSMKKQYNIQPSEEAFFKDFTDKIIVLMGEEMSWDKMRMPMVKIYSKHFTDKEVQDIIDFYKSKTGQVWIKKMPDIMLDTMLFTQELSQLFLPKMQNLSAEFRLDLTKRRKANIITEE